MIFAPLNACIFIAFWRVVGNKNYGFDRLTVLEAHYDFTCSGSTVFASNSSAALLFYI